MAPLQPDGSDSFVLLGTVTRAHGLQGEVKVRPLTESPASFARYRQLYLSVAGNGEKIPHTAVQARVSGQGGEVQPGAGSGCSPGIGKRS